MYIFLAVSLGMTLYMVWRYAVYGPNRAEEWMDEEADPEAALVSDMDMSESSGDE